MANKSSLKQDTKLTRGQLNIIVATALAGACLLFFWFWYTTSYLKPENVFWGTISNNLSVGHVTRTTAQKTDTRSLVQQTDLQFSPVLAARTTVNLSDPSGSQRVVTETIGTPNNDFLRYVEITGSEQPVNKEVIGLWAKQEQIEGAQPQILGDALLSGVLMFGDLNSGQQKEIVDELKNSGAFTKYDLKEKKTVDGKKVYVFDTEINIGKYSKVFKKYLEMISQKELAEGISVDAGDETYPFTLEIYAASRQPFSLTAASAKDSDVFSNFGPRREIIWPDTTLTINQLQEKL